MSHAEPLQAHPADQIVAEAGADPGAVIRMLLDQNFVQADLLKAAAQIAARKES